MKILWDDEQEACPPERHWHAKSKLVPMRPANSIKLEVRPAVMFHDPALGIMEEFAWRVTVEER